MLSSRVERWCQGASATIARSLGKSTMVGVTSTRIIEIACLEQTDLYDNATQLTSLASLGIAMTDGDYSA
jgi:hypothetical protein